MCGRLDYLEKNCTQTHPDGLRYYGLWLRANGQNQISLEDIAGELNRLNSRKVGTTQYQSPQTPTSKELTALPPSLFCNQKLKAIARHNPHPHYWLVWISLHPYSRRVYFQDSGLSSSRLHKTSIEGSHTETQAPG